MLAFSQSQYNLEVVTQRGTVGMWTQWGRTPCRGLTHHSKTAPPFPFVLLRIQNTLKFRLDQGTQSLARIAYIQLYFQYYYIPVLITVSITILMTIY